MTAGEIYRKTFPFVISKLLLAILTAGIAAVLLALGVGIYWLFRSETVAVIVFIGWLGAVGLIRFAIMHWFGYMVKAGHVAVIAEAVTTGRVPDNQVSYGKKKVIERFATSNVYFVVDKLVSGAVRQIQRYVEKAGKTLDFIPGMKALVGLAKFFVSISLSYIDECCLGWTFYKKEQGAFKSAADGVVIYAQNWKTLLKNAALTMAIVIVTMIIVIAVVFVALGLLFRLLDWPGLAAFALACLVAWVIKWAFIDSYILAQMMTAYMRVAPSTQITFDLYGKLSGVSSKFRELADKGKNERPPAGAAESRDAWDTAGGGAGGSEPGVSSGGSAPGASGGSAFCGQCGAKNKAGTKFCGSCGAKL